MVMRKAEGKHLLRSIRKGGISYLAVAVIAAVSIAIFHGFQSSGNAILQQADRYFKENNLETLEIACANGITQADLDAIAGWEGVTAVEGGYTGSVLLNTGEERVLVQARSLLDTINQPVVIEGSLPTAAGEVAIEENVARKEGIGVGDTITLEQDGCLTGDTFQVTAIINIPVFCVVSLLDARGTGTVGLGSNEYYVCLPEDAFDRDYYSDCYTTAYIDSDVLDGVYYFSDAYQEGEAAYLDRLEPLAQERAQLRYEELSASVQGEAEAFQMEDWVLSGRENVGDVRSVANIVDTIYGLSYVMALLFLLVAVVICFAASTRVIREQRVLIGAQKAQGFTPGEIFKHYTLYNLSCAVLGILLGWFLAITVVENLSLNIFAPKLCIGTIPLTFTWSTALISGGVCLAVFLIATFATCTKLVKEPAIDLLRGNAPTRGKRLFFEKWGFYQKLNLYSRTMIKNMFSDKGRMAATVVGVMGCTALLVVCFSIKLGIQNAAQTHFDHYASYDYRLVVDSQTGSVQDFADLLDREGIAYTLVQDKLKNVRGEGGAWETAHVVTSDDPKGLEGFFKLSDISSDREFVIPQGSVLVSRRAAETMGLSVGSTMELMDGKGRVRKAMVYGIIEHYLPYNLVVTGSRYYEQVMGESPDPCVFLLQGDVTGLAQQVQGMDGYLSLRDNSEYARSGEELDMVIAICTILSAVMLVLVLLNQITMYISRKARELAVMRVNGYTLNQTKAYVCKENVMLIILGLVAGCFFGVAMAYIDMRIIEAGAEHYVRAPNLIACLLACAIMAVFAVIVNIVALRKIDHLRLTHVSSN